MTKLSSLLTLAILLFASSACNNVAPTSPPPTTLTVPTLVANSTTSPELASSTPTHSPSPTALAAAPTPLATRLTPLATRHSPLATAPTPPATRHPPLATRHSPPPLTIHQFQITQIEDINPGKRITFQWSAAAAGQLCLVSGTSRRLNPWWDQLPLEGSLTVEIASTLYRDPQFTLQAYTSDDICLVPEAPAGAANRVTKTVTINWACNLDYFFTPAPQRCPLAPATTSAAAEQQFESGRLIWLEAENIIYAFHNDGHFQRYPNTWQEGQPESDPSLIPPDGHYQPVRGFGQLWRNQPGLRDQLGWALAPEQGYTTMHQFEHHEGSSSGTPAYLQTSSNETLWYLGIDIGPWGLGLP